MAPLALGLDVGGTKVAGVLIDEAGSILAQGERPSLADDPDEAVHTVVMLARELVPEGERPVGVGVGAAGMVDFEAGVFRSAPNLSWRELPLAARISEALGLPAVVDNDVNVAAWGEFRFGAARGHREILVVTVGTGIGGGIISGGRLVRGAHGFAGEIGHVIVQPGGPRCGCGNLGCWEQVASGNALGRLGRESAAERPGSAIARLAGSPEQVSGKHVTMAAQAGDHIALHIIREVGERLGEGLAGLANVLDPEIIVVGGGVADVGDLLLGPARRTFRDAIEAPEHRPEVPIVPAALGNGAGAIGAAALALETAR
jgi:glucokinase